MGLLWTRDRPVAETFTPDTTNTDKKQISLPLVRFEPTIPASERPQTYALDRPAARIGRSETAKMNTADTMGLS
jgi:hypothetical protein